MTIIAITGDPGVGKSTVVMRLVEALKTKGLKVGGIISREIRSDKIGRIGFEFIDLASNERYSLASTTGNGPRVGRYIINLDGCRFAADRLNNAIKNSDIIVCDELGPMEFKSKEFTDCVKNLLKTDKTVIVVVHKRMQHTLIDQFKKAANLLIKIDLQNRDKAHNLLLDRLR